MTMTNPYRCARAALFLLVVAHASHARAEDRLEGVSTSNEQARTSVLTIHPQVFPLLGGGLEYEGLLVRRWTVFAGAGLGTQVGGSEGTLSSPIGWDVEAGVRGFLVDGGPNGLWVGTKVGVATFSPDRVKAATAGAMVGYTFISRAGLVISAGAGLRLVYGMSTPLPDLRLSIGWAL